MVLAILSILSAALFPVSAQARGSARAAAAVTPDDVVGADGTHSDAQPHSPNILSAGDCHIEAQLGKDGTLELFIYGQTERQLYPIATTGPEFVMEARAMIPGQLAVPITLKAAPYPNEPAGMSSRFVGQIDPPAWSEQLAVFLTVALKGKNYLLRWWPKNLLSVPPDPSVVPAADPTMPTAVASGTAKSLFLSPGGLYTAQDIIANGRKTATQKYGTQMSMHNAHPKPGDRVCPITDTVANPKFSWIVGGKKYRFCCPPCIEEFVKKAKEKPKTIRAPETYIKSGQKPKLSAG